MQKAPYIYEFYFWEGYHAYSSWVGKKFMPIYECKNPPTIEGKVHKNPPIIYGRVHKNPPIHTPHDLCRFGS